MKQLALLSSREGGIHASKNAIAARLIPAFAGMAVFIAITACAYGPEVKTPEKASWSVGKPATNLGEISLGEMAHLSNHSSRKCGTRA